jgi:hypothetical protein
MQDRLATWITAVTFGSPIAAEGLIWLFPWHLDTLRFVQGSQCQKANEPFAMRQLTAGRVRFGPILLQKSQIAVRQFSRRKTKQAAIAD